MQSFTLSSQGDDCRWGNRTAPSKDLPALAGDERAWFQGGRFSCWFCNHLVAKVDEGIEVFQYVTPFSLELDDDENIIKDTEESSHPMIVLVFKQRSGKVEILKIQNGTP